MDREQTLEFIRTQVANGVVTPMDVTSTVGSTLANGTVVVSEVRVDPGTGIATATTQAAPMTTVKAPTADQATSKIALALYAVGAIIALIGIVMLVADNWNELGAVGRIIVTLGIGTATFTGGILFSEQRHRALAQVMYTMALVLLPLGTFVLLQEFDVKIDEFAIMTISALYAALFAYAYWHDRSPITVVGTAGLATIAYFVAVDLAIDDTIDSFDVVRLATIIAGAAYATIGWYYGRNPETVREGTGSVRSLLLAVGILGILVPLFTYDDGLIDGILLLLSMGAMYFAVLAASGTALAVSSLVLVAAIVKVVGEYFFETFGVAVALIVLGFIAIGIGYATVSLYRHRIAPTHGRQ